MQSLTPRIIQSLHSQRPVLFHESQKEATPDLVLDEWVFTNKPNLFYLAKKWDKNYNQLLQKQWDFFSWYFKGTPEETVTKLLKEEGYATK
ncbi:MAG: hypothetical protein GWN17_10360 [Candidatus Korarchaeota archaeon]|nr:hypothetical protein [Candidatus Korarchaeota archaeon]